MPMKRNATLSLFYPIIFCLITLISFSQLSYGQDGNRTPVPGTKYTLELPANYELGEGKNGFVNVGASSAIMVMGYMGSNLEVAEMGMTPEEMAKQGYTWIADEKTKVDNGAAAHIYKLTFDNNGMKYVRIVLLTGRDFELVRIDAVYPLMMEEYMDEQVRKSLLTIQF